MTGRAVALTAAVLVVVGCYAAGSVRWTTRGRDWYRSLPRPRWQPPDAVFGVVWPLNFGALAVVGVLVAFESTPREGVAWVALLAASVLLALGWAHTFYVRHSLGPAAALLAGAAVLTWGLVALSVALVSWAGLALVPYAVWLCVATALAVAYRRLAPPAGGPVQGSGAEVHPRRAAAPK